MALLYWDPDGISSNNVLSTGAGLGGSGIWSNAGSTSWFNPTLNSGLGGYVSWNNSLGDTAIFAGLNGSSITINGQISAAGLEFRGTNVLISGGSFQTTAGSTSFATTLAARFDTPISGSGGIQKTGAGSLTLGSPLSTYTGDTIVSGGLLDVRGTIQSHVRISGSGSVQGVMFYDPDLAASVREALGVDSNAWLSPTLLNQAAPLTSLTADANRVDDITGISNLSALTSFSLLPTDYAVNSPGLASLAPLTGLTRLTSLTLQDVNLNNTSLGTLPALPNLAQLDVRYNGLSVIPTNIGNLPRLASLQVHGNTLLSDNPRTGLSSLKGKLIDVDVAPDRPEIASNISDLAGRLYHLPLKMLEHVTNTIEFQPYSGAMKGSLATLQTKSGNSWDTNSLLADLFAAAGIATRYVPGAIEISETQLKDFVGTRDTIAAAKVLGAAGLQYDQFANRLKHTWLEALLVDPTTNTQRWVPVDAAWKVKDYRPGLAGVLSNVPFSPLESDYLTNPTWQKKSTAEYYEAKVGTWLATNRPELTTADVSYDGAIVQQTFKSLPSLPYTIINQPAEAQRTSSIPTSANYTVNIQLANGTTALFGTGGVNLTLADVALSRLTIDPQFNATGSARPVLRRNGVVVATAPAAIANAANTPLTLTFRVTAPAGGFSYSRTFSRAADRYIAIGLDANQFSEALLAEKRGTVNVQQLNQANGALVDQDQAVGGILDLAIAQYFTAANADEESLAGLTSAIANRTAVALGIATSAPSLSTSATAGLQFPFLPLDMGLDVPANVSNAFAIDASTGAVDLNRNLILGYSNSALEGLILEELTNFEGVSTMKAFQRAATASGGLGNLVEINATNVGNIAALLPGVRLEIRNAIANIVRNGLSGVADFAGVTFKALVPRNEIAVGSGTDVSKQWKGVGYTLTCVTSDPAKAHLNGSTVGYIIHGAVGNNPLVSHGGATSRIFLPPPTPQPSFLYSKDEHGQGDPVNVANGNVYHEESDIEFPNLGVNLDFKRRYDSIATASGLPGSRTAWSDRGMGEGWSFAYADRLEFNTDGANTLTWFTGEGLRLVFTVNGNTYTNPSGLYGVLTGQATAGFTWQDFDGNRTTFGAAVAGFSHILTKQDRFGNGVAISYVTGTNRIARVSDLRDASRFLSFTYNADSRPHLTAIADFTGRSWTYTYGADGRLTSVTKPLPGPGTAAPVIRYTYHADNARRGLLASVVDPSGFSTSWDYFANRRGFRVTDTEGLRHSFSYDLYRRRTAFINEAGDAIRFSYDEQGNLLETVQPDRTTERSTWSTSGLKLSTTDAYGATTLYSYDPGSGKVTSITDPLGNVTSFTYTPGPFRDLAQITKLYRPNDSSDDVVTTLSYDTTGFLTSRVEDFGTGRLNATTRYTPATGGRGLVQTTTSPRGVATNLTYNTAGQVLSRSTPISSSASATETFTYDNRGNRLSSTDANGNRTSFAYDALGRLLSTTSADPDGIGPLPALSSTHTYDIAGNLLSTTLQDGRVNRTGYDRRQRQVRQTAADGTYVLISYDPVGNKVSETDASGRITRFLYDARNRLVARVHPDGTTERIRVDGGGRVVARVNQTGATTLTSYDKLGRKVREVQPDPDGGGPLSAPSSAWGYDSRGNLEFETRFFVGQSGVVAGDPARSSHFSYDALGRKIRETQADPDGSGPLSRPVSSWTYDADGNQLSLTDPRGFTSSYAYDALGRMTTLTTPDPDGAGPLLPLQTRFVYDLVGNLRYTVAPGGANESDTAFTTERIYDALNREVQVVSPDPDGVSGPLSRPTTRRSYNASGFLASSSDALGQTTSFVYDRMGRVLAETNALGGVTRMTYDASGNRLSTTDALGRSTFTSYDAMNRVQTVRAPRATLTAATPVSSFAYDATGNLIASIDALGRRRWQQFDALGRLISQTNPLGGFAGDPGATIRSEYDAAGRLTAKTDELGRRTETVYDNLGRQIRLLAPDAGLGRPTTHYGYDAAGNLRFRTDPRGGSAGDPNFTTWFFYDGLARPLATVDALGADWSPSAIPDGLPSTVTTNVTRNVYDNRGRVAASIDALGRQTSYGYDNLSRRISTTTPAPQTGAPPSVTLTAYDAMGQTLSVTDPLGLVTRYSYDALNRRTLVTDPRGFATQTSFDAVGNTVSITDASGNVTRYGYDRNNRLTSETDPLGNSTSYGYDLVGNKIRETDRLNRVTSYIYDTADRLVEERWQASQLAPVSHTIQRIYDRANQLLGVSETDTVNAAATTTWQFTYDANGKIIKSRMAPGEIMQSPSFSGAPNPAGSLTTSDPTLDWDSDGVAERYDGYAINLAVGDQLFLTASSTSFDPVLMVQKPNGNLTSAFFDDHSGGGTTARVLITADLAGTWIFAVTAKEEQALGNYDLRIIQDKNAIVSTALLEYDFTYDKAGNLLSASEDQAAVATMSAFGKAASGLGVSSTFAVDGLNRVTRYQQIDAATAAVSKQANVTYRPDGSVSAVTRFAGAGLNAIGTSTASYDGMGRLTGLTHSPSASASIAYGYAYDAASRMISMTTPEGTSSFGLDASNQLLNASLTGEAYTYDNTGNRRSGGTQTGTGNRLLFDGTYRYAYDAEGNRTAKYLDTNAGGTLSVGDTDVTLYGYDQRNRLVAVSHVNTWTNSQAAALGSFAAMGAGLPGSDLELRYTYDYADRRIRRSIDADGMAGVGQDSVSFAGYAGDVRTLEITRPNDKLLVDRTGRIVGFLGQVVQRNFYGNGVDEILAVDQISWNGATPNTSTFWTFTDHQDSVRDIVSGTGANRGQVVEHRQYDSFGRIIRRTTAPQAGAASTAGVGISFGYAGRPLEARTGLSDNRARWYEPGTGKFINEDPSGFKGGDVNLFRYVGNDPLNQVDPSGLVAETIWDIANIGMGLYSAQDNFRKGNWGWLALDVGGLIYDGVATAVPFLPAGASAGLKAARAGNTVIHSVNAGLDVAAVSNHVHKAAKAIDTTASTVPWQAALDGSRLHRQVAEKTADSMRYFDSSYMAGANRSSGIQPDMKGTGIWADITTPGQWQKHVNKYSPGFGEGIPIKYERGVGVVDTPRLLPGAGAGLSTLQEGLGVKHYRTDISDTWSSLSGANSTHGSALSGWRWNKK